ncbi:MAG: type II secretion system protein GspL [Rhodoferax sp.]|nr:type II secretion system protein GspL [Rhodoferax sp.]
MLIITLPLQPADPSALLDCVQSPHGSTLGSYVRTALALLPASDKQTEVVALVPLAALSWHQVQLPVGSLQRSMRADRTTRLRTILDGLLEDQLLDEPAAMHLALQPQAQAGSPVWVAACDKAWLGAALAALAQAGYQVTRIVPESSPQALADAIEVTGEAEQAWVAGLLRSPDAASQTPAAASAPEGMAGTHVLSCQLSATAVGLLDPDTPVLAEPAVAALAEQLLARPVTLQQRGQRLLQAAQSPWNLAQFDFTNAQRDPRAAALKQGLQRFAKAPQWRAARWALGVLLLGNLVGLNAWALRGQSNLSAQRQAVRAVLTDTFPKIPVVVDAPLQMAREVAALQRASGSAAGTNMESILASFSALAPAGYALTAIDYVAPELRLSGPAIAAADQQRLTQGLQAVGLSASAQGNQWLIRPQVAP